ncbi:hypothetical protein [Clostridium sp. JS66]|uniref:hypothetical protein n=1 Tax=Clostridium sp. JS66 TaxID=3064705 RepID=UPI00298EBEF0|nr:hypothetical protein [Clostridium sp. JS66]WPC43011.1 hypothetical protein Q6H37_05930 [Clostridium sp. JS66]
MNKKLEYLIEFVPAIKSLVGGDCAINVTSENECICVLNGEKIKSPLEKVSIDQAKSTEEILDTVKKITSNSKVLLNNVKNN